MHKLVTGIQECRHFFYEVVLLPGNVSVCYGCHKKFEPESRTFPNNIIIKHMDRRITGTSPTGLINFGKDFTAYYYHFDLQHIASKNQWFIHNPVVHISQTLWKQLEGNLAFVQKLQWSGGMILKQI